MTWISLCSVYMAVNIRHDSLLCFFINVFLMSHQKVLLVSLILHLYLNRVKLSCRQIWGMNDVWDREGPSFNTLVSFLEASHLHRLLDDWLELYSGFFSHNIGSVRNVFIPLLLPLPNLQHGLLELIGYLTSLLMVPVHPLSLSFVSLLDVLDVSIRCWTAPLW